MKILETIIVICINRIYNIIKHADTKEHYLENLKAFPINTLF